MFPKVKDISSDIMHEWAIAEAVVVTAAKAADREGLTKVTEIVVSLGDLQQIDREVFEFALTSMMTPYKELMMDTRLSFIREPARLKCRACGHEWEWNNVRLDKNAEEAIHFVPEMAHTYLRCPKCKSPDFEIIQGRGVWVDSVIGEKQP